MTDPATFWLGLLASLLLSAAGGLEACRHQRRKDRPVKRKNNPLFQVGTAESVDLNTGESVPVEGGGLRMLPGPPGTCAWCHTEHDPRQSHNQQSLPYRMKFHTLHGRQPTWTDAMQHCTPEVQAAWRKQLVELMKAHGMDIPADLLG